MRRRPPRRLRIDTMPWLPCRLWELADRVDGCRLATAVGASAERAPRSPHGALLDCQPNRFSSRCLKRLYSERRGRELALLRPVGATPRQVRSMARWEAGLIVTIGLGLGLAVAATALLPLSHALNGSLRPYVPAVPLAAIPGTSALLAVVALALPTRRALRTPAVEAIGIGE